MSSDLDLLDLHVAALFRHDARGRIVGSNEPDGYAAPRVYLGRTPQGNRWRFSHALPDALASELDALLRNEPPAVDPRRPPAVLDAVTRLLAAHGPTPTVESGPAYIITDTVAPSADAALVRPGDADALRRHYPWTSQELPHRLPCAAVLRDGVAVAICFSARNTPDAAEAGVDTVAESRRQGFAAAVVATWAAAVRASGRLPLYSTSWENVASQGVARRLGMRLYGVDTSFE